MFKMFIGMIIGSLMTIMLLGGPPVADRILQNSRVTMEAQYAQSGSAISVYLLAFLIIILVSVATSNTKQSKQNSLAIKKLRRYHSLHN